MTPPTTPDPPRDKATHGERRRVRSGLTGGHWAPEEKSPVLPPDETEPQAERSENETDPCAFVQARRVGDSTRLTLVARGNSHVRLHIWLFSLKEWFGTGGGPRFAHIQDATILTVLCAGMAETRNKGENRT